MDGEVAISNLEMIHAGLVAIAETLADFKRENCH
jgi:hypothetical protein